MEKFGRLLSISDIMKKKRIVFIILRAYPLFINSIGNPSHGGAEIDLYNIAKGLNTDIFDVHFIVGDYGQEKLITIDNITLHKGQALKNSNILNGIINFLKLSILILKINPDIIFSKGVSWQSIQLIIIKKILRKKLALKSSHKRNIDGTLNCSLFGKIFKSLIQNIDFFILQNKEDEETFLKVFPGFKNTLTTIRNAQHINPYTSRVFSKTLLWIGRSEAFKQPQEFLEIAKSCPTYKCTMIMPNTNHSIFNKINNSATHIGNIEIIAGVPREIIESYYRNAAFLISTSINEGFPNVILESMKNGTPIISFLDYDNIIKNNNCGLISKDILEISSFISEIDQKKWERMSINAYNFSKENFNVGKIIHDYEKLFIS